MPDIRTLVSSELPEPKRISDSTIADAGKVITPAGSGDSELRKLTPEEVGINFVFGEMSVDQVTTSFPVSAASDNTLYTDADYILLNSSRVSSVQQEEASNITFDNVNNTLSVSQAGIYRITGWFNALSNLANTKIGIRYSLNGAAVGSVIKSDVKDSGRVMNINGFGFITLNANDNVGVAIASDKNADLTISDFSVTLELIKGS